MATPLPASRWQHVYGKHVLPAISWRRKHGCARVSDNINALMAKHHNTAFSAVNNTASWLFLRLSHMYAVMEEDGCCGSDNSLRRKDGREKRRLWRLLPTQATRCMLSSAKNTCKMNSAAKTVLALAQNIMPRRFLGKPLMPTTYLPHFFRRHEHRLLARDQRRRIDVRMTFCYQREQKLAAF